MQLRIQAEDYDNSYSFIIVNDSPGGRSIVEGPFTLIPWEEHHDIPRDARNTMSRLETQDLIDRLFELGFRPRHSTQEGELMALKAHLKSETETRRALLQLQNPRGDLDLLNSNSAVDRVQELEREITQARSRLAMYETDGVVDVVHVDTAAEIVPPEPAPYPPLRANNPHDDAEIVTPRPYPFEITDAGREIARPRPVARDELLTIRDPQRDEPVTTQATTAIVDDDRPGPGDTPDNIPGVRELIPVVEEAVREEVVEQVGPYAAHSTPNAENGGRQG